jgi:hypothetical protein
MDGTHGDAAFADWLLIVSYSRRFGGKADVEEPPPVCESDGG